MSFFGKTITNRFPKWSKIYSDESSNGAIMLDTIGRSLERFRQTSLNYKKQKKVLEEKFILTYPNSYRIDLPNYTYDIEKRNVRSMSWTFEGRSLDIYDNWSDYNLALPKTFKLKNIKENFINLIDTIIFDENVSSSENVYDFNKVEKSLFIDCRGIEYFKNGNTHKNFGLKFDSGEIEGVDEKYYITIRGKDYFDKPIEEIIPVYKKDIYQTKNKFIKICSLVSETRYVKQRDIIGGPSIEAVGIVGEVKIKEYDLDAKEQILKDTLSVVSYNPFSLVNKENSYIENNLKIKITEENEIEYIHSFFTDDSRYFSIERKDLKEEVTLAKVKLFDAFERSIEVLSWAYDYKRKLIYAIDKNKKLYFYNVERPMLVNKKFISRTSSIDLELETNKSFFSLNETARISLLITRPKTSIRDYYIFRYKPSTLNTEINWEVEFLNDSLGWSSEVYGFKGGDNIDKYENLISKGFKDVLDEYGQYDYYIVNTNKEITYVDKLDFRNKLNLLIKKEPQGFSCNKTSILVPKSLPLNEYHLTELPDLNRLQKEKYELSFDKILNRLIVKHKESLYTFEEIDDKIFFNWLEGVAFTQSQYDGLKILIEYEDGSNYQCEVNYE